MFSAIVDENKAYQQVNFTDLSIEDQAKYTASTVETLEMRKDLVEARALEGALGLDEVDEVGPFDYLSNTQVAQDDLSWAAKNWSTSYFDKVQSYLSGTVGKPTALTDFINQPSLVGKHRPGAVNQDTIDKLNIGLNALQSKYPGLEFTITSGKHLDPNFDPAKLSAADLAAYNAGKVTKQDLLAQGKGKPSGRHANGAAADGQFTIDGKVVTDAKVLGDIAQTMRVVDPNFSMGYNTSKTITHVDFTNGTNWTYGGAVTPKEVKDGLTNGSRGIAPAGVSVAAVNVDTMTTAGVNDPGAIGLRDKIASYRDTNTETKSPTADVNLGPVSGTQQIVDRAKTAAKSVINAIAPGLTNNSNIQTPGLIGGIVSGATSLARGLASLVGLNPGTNGNDTSLPQPTIPGENISSSTEAFIY
jgi:hypothetical protein